MAITAWVHASEEWLTSPRTDQVGRVPYIAVTARIRNEQS